MALDCITFKVSLYGACRHGKHIIPIEASAVKARRAND